MIYISKNTDLLGEGFLEQAENFISLQRAEKLKGYSVLSDRVNGTVVYLLLRYGLEMEYGIKEKPVFEFGEREKPFLKDRSGIFFNLSHCRNAAACIISDNDTAIDIMEIRKVRESTIRRTCTEKEKISVLSSCEPEREFIRLWTRKECYSKFDGRGLLLDFSEINENMPEMKCIHTLDCGEYILSYYSEKPVKRIAVKAEELLEI